MKTLGLPVSDKKNCKVCLLCSYVQNCDPWGRASSDPNGHGKYVLGRGLRGDTAYQISKLKSFSFREKEF